MWWHRKTLLYYFDLLAMMKSANVPTQSLSERLKVRVNLHVPAELLYMFVQLGYCGCPPRGVVITSKRTNGLWASNVALRLKQLTLPSQTNCSIILLVGCPFGCGKLHVL